MIEFALTIPIYIMALFCFLQLVLLIHAKFMLTYGAFVAARAGVVYNANEAPMKKAFLSVMSPYFGRVQEGNDSFFSDILTPFTGNSAFEKAFDKATDEWNDNQFTITVVSPENANTLLKGAKSLNDAIPEFNNQVLKVEVTWNFPLVIPVANRLFHYFLDHNDPLTYSGPDPGVVLAPDSEPADMDDLRIPLSGQYTLRLSGINQNNPYHS